MGTKKIILLVCLLCNMTLCGLAQHLGMYAMRNLPQRASLNPSFSPEGEMHIGLPLLSGAGFSYSNNVFSYSDIFKKGNASQIILDLQPLLEKLNNRNHISLGLEADLFSAGIKLGKNYITIHATEKITFDFDFSKQVATFLINGNAVTAGTIQNLNPSLEGIHYREYGLNWSGALHTKLRTGVRLKYLYGMEHLINTGSGVNIYTDPGDFTITASSNMTIHTSGLDTSATFSFGDYAFGKKNNGYAIDIGFTWNPVPKVELSGSLADFGKMRWKSNVSTYSSITENEAFNYQGINLNDFINNDSTSSEAYLQNLGDSLYNSLDITTTHNSYTYKLPLKVFFSAAYKLTEKLRIYGLIRHRQLQAVNLTDYQLGFAGSAGRILGYAVSMNRINNTAITPGAGLTIQFRSNQLYFVTDNVLSIVRWKDSYHTGFRAGYNLVFGTGGKKAPQPVLDPIQ